MYFWWKDENYNKVSKKVYTSVLPYPLSEIQLYFYKNNVQNQLDVLQFKNDDDVEETANIVFATLSGKLGTQKYFFGNQPSSLDALVFGHLAVHLFAPLPKENLRNLLTRYSNLQSFVENMAREFWGSVPNYQAHVEKVKKDATDSNAMWNSVVFTIGIGACMWLFANQAW